MNMKPKRPKDTNQLAKFIAEIAADEVVLDKSYNPSTTPASKKQGRAGGLKGGQQRANKLTSEQRSQIARKAAFSRWLKAEK